MIKASYILTFLFFGGLDEPSSSDSNVSNITSSNPSFVQGHICFELVERETSVLSTCVVVFNLAIHMLSLLNQTQSYRLKNILANPEMVYQEKE